MEDKEWVLKYVEYICADTRDVDEVCVALEHSTIFATEMIQDLTQTMFDLQQELSKANEKLEKIEEYIEDSMKLGHHIDTNKSIYSIGINNILKIIKGDEDK